MKRILFVLFIMLFLIGCSNDEAYNNAIQKGLDYVASEEYSKAESAFELALDEKKEDEKATVLLSQTIDYQEVIKAIEEGEFDFAKEKANAVIELDGGSSALVKKSEDALASMKDFEEKLSEITKDYKNAQKQFKAKEYDKAQKTIDNILKQDLENVIFNSIKTDIESLQKDIKSSLEAEAKAAEEERIAQEKAKQEKASEEQAIKEENANKFTADKAIQMVQSGYGNDGGTQYRVVEGPLNTDEGEYYMVELYEVFLDGQENTLFYVQVFENGTLFDIDAKPLGATKADSYWDEDF